MKKFIDLVKEHYNILLEQTPEAAAPAAPAAPAVDATVPSSGGAPAGNVPDLSGMPGMGGDQQVGATASEDSEESAKYKRESDPNGYVEEVFDFITSDDTGITPQMFSDYIDSIQADFTQLKTKVRDKESFKMYYNKFYKKIDNLFNIIRDVKTDYKDIFDTLKNAKSNVKKIDEPDQGGGGVGRAGPAGPGVK